MGGSLALALRPIVSRLIVVDTDDAALAEANELADKVTDDLADGAREGDLIVLATPVRTILNHLHLLPSISSSGRSVVDLGSTKRQIEDAMERLPQRFQAIGGHPICGKETRGFSASSSELFRERSFVLCRNARTGPEVERLALAMVTSIGARPLFMSAERHDELLASSSHLPYLLSSALMQLSRNSGGEQLWRASASGFRDVARLSGSDGRMMLDILMTNRDKILDRLDAYQEVMAVVAEMIRSGNEAALVEWLNEASRLHGEYRSAVSSRWGV